MQDIGLNLNEDNLGIELQEIADTTRPIIESATLNYTDGMLEIVASETLDATPTSLVVLENIVLANETGDIDGGLYVTSAVVLSSATVIAVDGTTITLKLYEEQRARAISLSGVTGGDGSPALLDVYDGGVVDLAGNTVLDDLASLVVESPDIKASFSTLCICQL